MVSIIIPAFNEEAVIGRTLAAVLEGSQLNNLEIIVCCNGCSDRTAEIARAFGPPVQVVETERGSKTLALNMGDAASISFPRIYLDADIILDQSAISAILAALEDPKVLAVAPRMRVDLTHRKWVIRAFYDIWMRSPYHRRGMIGSGVYALSQQGRSRFVEFPDIIADDGFVRAHFGPRERHVLDECSFTVTPPTTLSALLRIKTRAALGMKELSHKFPQLIQKLARAEADAGPSNEWWTVAMSPSLWPKLAVYVFVKGVASFRANRQLRKLNDYSWERDESSRIG